MPIVGLVRMLVKTMCRFAAELRTLVSFAVGAGLIALEFD